MIEDLTKSERDYLIREIKNRISKNEGIERDPTESEIQDELIRYFDLLLDRF